MPGLLERFTESLKGKDGKWSNLMFSGASPGALAALPRRHRDTFGGQLGNVIPPQQRQGAR